MAAYLSYPLSIKNGRFGRTPDLKASIDASLDLLVSTPVMESVCCPLFGFVFNNYRFESFNENEGTVRSSASERGYGRKISGSSINVNTFASALKQAIEDFEPRLGNVKVAMSYVREERKIYINVRGEIKAKEAEYSYDTTIKAWN